MLLKDVADQLHITKRAIKLYEEKGLIKVKKDENGYRNYSTEDIDTLHKISIYRKLGISLKDIKRLLAVYYEQNVTTEKFEDFDGERWIIPDD